MKKILIVAALAASLAACQKAEEATVVEAVPANEAAAATGTEPAAEPAVEMPAEETAAKN